MAYIGQKPADKPLGASDITDGIISNSKLAQDIISGETELAEAPASTDEFLISDAGVLKRLDASLVGGGKINQVVTTHKTDYFETTSGSFVDVTGASVSITPSATSSKVLFMITGTFGKYESGNFHLKVLRDSTAILTNTTDQEHPNQNYDYYFGQHIVDSPSSTSALTYKIQVKTDGGTTAINSRASSPANRGTTTLTVMEILS
nr:hypothetical protein [uncultured Mediterranean phage uvMED]